MNLPHKKGSNRKIVHKNLKYYRETFIKVLTYMKREIFKRKFTISLKTIYEENTRLKPCRFSMANYREQEWMVNVPLYLAREWIESTE